MRVEQSQFEQFTPTQFNLSFETFVTTDKYTQNNNFYSKKWLRKKNDFFIF